MAMVIQEHCRRHPNELAVDRCPECLEEYCGQCLMYPKGPNRPPLCLQCALARAGVRSSGPPKRSWRRRRRQERVRRLAIEAMHQAQARAARDAKAAEPTPIDTTGLAPSSRPRGEWDRVEGTWSSPAGDDRR